MTSPAPEPEKQSDPVDLNSVQAEDVTIPTPEFTEPPPPPETKLGTPPRRPWRTPPRGPARKTTPRKTPPGVPNTVEAAVKSIPKPRKGEFVKPLTQSYTSVGIMLMPVDPVCANLFIVNAEAVAKAWDQAAYENDSIRVFLTKFLETSIGVRIAMAHLPIFLGMLLHHSKHAQEMLGKMGEGFAETVENNMRAGDMGNGIGEP
jgi:hypothetical protein